MDCEQAETKSEERSAEAESVENSDIELSNNSPNGWKPEKTISW